MKRILFSLLLLPATSFAQTSDTSQAYLDKAIYITKDTSAVAVLDTNGELLEVTDTSAALTLMAKALVEQSQSAGVARYKLELLTEILKCVRTDGVIPNMMQFKAAVAAYKAYKK